MTMYVSAENEMKKAIYEEAKVKNKGKTMI